MGTIDTTQDLSRNLTVIVATGKMKPEDFHEWTETYYRGTVTSLTLWDLTQADLSDLRSEDLRSDAIHTKALADVRKGGKTAIVSSNSLEFGLSRVLEAFYDMENVPFEVEVFTNTENAMKWLTE